MKEKTAKIIRVITVPPVLVTALILILVFSRPDIFRHVYELLLCFICLAVIPVLAYPLQPVLPKYRASGREGQRKLAFMLSFAGYTFGMLLGFILQVTVQLQLIFNTYFVSVILLIIFNRLLHLRASGHACSITGPLLFLVYFTGPAAVFPCVLIFILVIWSSLILKRHTPKDLTFGALVCIISFILNYLLMFIFVS